MQLLDCYIWCDCCGDGQVFDLDADGKLTDAIKAGWAGKNGEIFCPSCAAKHEFDEHQSREIIDRFVLDMAALTQASWDSGILYNDYTWS